MDDDFRVLGETLGQKTLQKDWSAASAMDSRTITCDP